MVNIKTIWIWKNVIMVMFSTTVCAAIGTGLMNMLGASVWQCYLVGVCFGTLAGLFTMEKRPCYTLEIRGEP